MTGRNFARDTTRETYYMHDVFPEPSVNGWCRITLVNRETCALYLNTDTYMKFFPDSVNDIGFAMLMTVFKQVKLFHFVIFST